MHVPEEMCNSTVKKKMVYDEKAASTTHFPTASGLASDASEIIEIIIEMAVIIICIMTSQSIGIAVIIAFVVSPIETAVISAIIISSSDVAIAIETVVIAGASVIAIAVKVRGRRIGTIFTAVAASEYFI